MGSAELQVTLSQLVAEVYKAKWDSKGKIQQFKAIQLLKVCFSQRKEIDFRDTFSRVSNKASFRIIMPLGACFNLELHLMDVNKDCLHGLYEEVYTTLPEGLGQKVKSILYTN